MAARRKIATLISRKEEEIIFTQSATYAINTVAQGISFKPRDRIVTTALEHHSNFLPWLRLVKRGVEVTVVKASATGHLELDDFQGAIDENTKLVAATHFSNVLGTITPIAKLSPLGEVEQAEYVLVFRIHGKEISVFADGRAIIKGTDDIKLARSLYARYVGVKRKEDKHER